MAGPKTPNAIRLSSDGPSPPRKARVHLPSGTRPVELVPVKGFQAIPAGDEAETTTSLAIGKYATLVSHEEDDDFRITGDSGLHPIPDIPLPDIPIDVVEVAFAQDRVARVDPRAEPPREEEPTLVADEVTTERRPQIDSVVRLVEKEETTQTLTETLTEPRPIPGPDLSGMQLETVPLSPAIVKFAIASVEARAAARAAGRPLQSPLPPPPPLPPMAAAPPLYQPLPLPFAPPAPPEPEERSLGVEIAIGVVTFLAVAAPAFWYLFLR